jgi:hypothetical protein
MTVNCVSQDEEIHNPFSFKRHTSYNFIWSAAERACVWLISEGSNNAEYTRPPFFVDKFIVCFKLAECLLRNLVQTLIAQIAECLTERDCFCGFRIVCGKRLVSRRINMHVLHALLKELKKFATFFLLQRGPESKRTLEKLI